jgi:hypothetical protein
MDSQYASTINHGPIGNATLQRKAAASCGHKEDIGTICGDMYQKKVTIIHYSIPGHLKLEFQSANY